MNEQAPKKPHTLNRYIITLILALTQFFLTIAALENLNALPTIFSFVCFPFTLLADLVVVVRLIMDLCKKNRGGLAYLRPLVYFVSAGVFMALDPPVYVRVLSALATLVERVYPHGPVVEFG